MLAGAFFVLAVLLLMWLDQDGWKGSTIDYGHPANGVMQVGS